MPRKTASEERSPDQGTSGGMGNGRELPSQCTPRGDGGCRARRSSVFGPIPLSLGTVGLQNSLPHCAQTLSRYRLHSKGRREKDGGCALVSGRHSLPYPHAIPKLPDLAWQRTAQPITLRIAAGRQRPSSTASSRLEGSSAGRQFNGHCGHGADTKDDASSPRKSET
jgi:hypothetical protein